MTRLPNGGPKVVAIGGGHGLAASLRAARLYASTVTAVVSVADDGGSSGRLRAALGIPAPGDLRRCLVALAEDPDGLWARVFEHRFDSGELDGHAVGNLVIAGLAAGTGSFSEALAEAARLVGAAGRVLPATDSPVVLKAIAAGEEVEGQLAVSLKGRISRVTLVPPIRRPMSRRRRPSPTPIRWSWARDRSTQACWRLCRSREFGMP